MPKPSNRRRIYIIDPDFQYRFIRRLCYIGISIIVMSLLFLAIVHNLYGDVKLVVTQPDPFESGHMITQQPMETSSLFSLLWPVMAICVGITLVFLFFFGVIASHRLAGPIYRIRVTLQEMTSGDLSGAVKLRKKDEFKHLAKEINLLKSSLRNTMTDISDILKSADPAEANHYQSTMTKLADIRSRYKVE